MKNLILVSAMAITFTCCENDSARRIVVSLNGQWEIAKTGSILEMPDEYNSTAPVPGLVDLAEPAVDAQDTVYDNSVYWHRRRFRIEEPGSEKVILKINKARYHTRVWINGKPAGENVYNFTPVFLGIKSLLNKTGDENEIVIAVGCRNNLPDTVINGWDFEKIKYIPGIYDDVSLICTGYPYIENIQVVPDIGEHKLRVVAVAESDKPGRVMISYKVREAVSGKIVSEGDAEAMAGSTNDKLFADFTAPVPDCRLWSPEDPFLYELELATKGDRKSTRFGMRSFRASPDSGIFLLNEKPYYMRGTNVCIYRFFEDPDRAGLPWDKKWVTKLHSKFREMHWTSIRYCIGFPPESWYEIADSLGFLIQDEYPLWTLAKENFAKYLGNLNSQQIGSEYREWMRERWNHPCVVIWDAQNESITDSTGKAINMARKLDLSDRPWDNGWAPPVSPSDAIESHPYLFSRYQWQKPSREGYLKDLFGEVRIPGNDPNSHYPLPDGRRFENPVILNEYGWIWLNRDGSTTTLTDKVYENVWPWAITPEQRLEIFGRTLGILTEYWRSHRKAAAVMHFCGLGYSRPGRPRGQTSDHFVDIRNLEFEPNFYKYVRPAFSPVGVMIDFWDRTVSGGEKVNFRIRIINDTDKDYRGNIEFRLLENSEVRFVTENPVELAAYGIKVISLPVVASNNKGKYSVEASLIYEQQKVTSRREFIIE